MSQKIIITGFISDCPGYAGNIEFEILGNRLIQTTFGGCRGAEEFELPKSVPLVTAARGMLEGDTQGIFNCLPDYTRDYLHSADSFQLERGKMLAFEDGRTGFLLVHGDACFFSLVVGDELYEFSDGEIAVHSCAPQGGGQ